MTILDRSNGPPVMSADSEPNPRDESLNPFIGRDDSSNTHRSRTSFLKNWTTLKVACVCVTISFVIAGLLIGFVHLTRKTTADTEPERPGVGQAQQQSGGTGSNINAIPAGIVPAFKYLQSKGLDVPLRASNSCCPPEICRKRRLKMFVDTHPKIFPDRTCTELDVLRVANKSCLMCQSERNKTEKECFSFEQVLRYDNCSQHSTTGCEKAHMANLTGYCNNGTAVSVGRYDFKCDCFHGRAGDRCEKEEESENVSCVCYDRKIKLLESWKKLGLKNCHTTYYNPNVTCIRSFSKENCYCEADLNSNLQNCDIQHPVAERHRSNDAQRPKSFSIVFMCVFCLIVRFYGS